MIKNISQVNYSKDLLKSQESSSIYLSTDWQISGNSKEQGDCPEDLKPRQGNPEINTQRNVYVKRAYALNIQNKETHDPNIVGETTSRQIGMKL